MSFLIILIEVDMKEITTLVLIGFALSADAFSVALSVGAMYQKKGQQLLLAVLVGLAHFFMPMLGLYIGTNVISKAFLNSNIVISVILLFLAIELLLDIKKDEKPKLIFNIIGVFFFVMSVSLDSFSTGLGLYAITYNYILAGTLFAIISMTLTYCGLYLGKTTKEKYGNIANVFGAIILFTLAIVYLINGI